MRGGGGGMRKERGVRQPPFSFFSFSFSFFFFCAFILYCTRVYRTLVTFLCISRHSIFLPPDVRDRVPSFSKDHCIYNLNCTIIERKLGKRKERRFSSSHRLIITSAQLDESFLSLDTNKIGVKQGKRPVHIHTVQHVGNLFAHTS